MNSRGDEKEKAVYARVSHGLSCMDAGSMATLMKGNTEKTPAIWAKAVISPAKKISRACIRS